MNSLDALARPWLAWMVAASWQLALLVVIVAVLAAALQRWSLSARLRHGLWLLVLLKVFLPPTLATPLSVGYWLLGPALDEAGWRQMAVGSLWRPEPAATAAAPAAGDGAENRLPEGKSGALGWPVMLFIGWAAGLAAFGGVIAWRYLSLARLIAAGTVIDEGPARVTLERVAIDLGLKSVPELIVTPQRISPFLCSVVRTRIVLPQGALSELSEEELQAVLTHELVHWQRYDTWIGWLQVVAQGLFWFHPLVWWANSQLRHQRECACDEAVLSEGRLSRESYGETLIRVLLAASVSRSPAVGSLVGVFERGANLQQRLENIMSYEPSRRRFVWSSVFALAALAILLLPMAPRLVEPPLIQAQEGKPAPAAKGPMATGPQIVSTTPKNGATDVGADVAQISVTFDRDMQQGMSWTGGPPLFPPMDEGRAARWVDARTCVLPVKLAKGSYYRVGINSSSHRNFRSTEGAPAAPSAIYFVTEGAGADVQARVQPPRIINLSPANGAMDVDPATKVLSVTFDMPMSEGASWTGGGPQFPQLPNGAKPGWSADGKTCTLPVALEAGHEYQLGLNSASYNNFQSKWGVPLEPVAYTFRTRAAK